MMKTILVVDDNADNRYLLLQMLKLNGYSVICAINGREALDVVRQQTPDLVLMDMSMPVMDGWTATEMLKSQPKLAHIPVIAVTGHLTIDDLRRARDVGCSDHLDKPIDYEVLVNKVASHLRHPSFN
jgi:two-component system, cell cycle response regulator DivK